MRYLNFGPDFFGHEGKRLDKKAKVTFKTQTLSPGEQMITIHILPNILRIKGNQTMRFGQSINRK